MASRELAWSFAMFMQDWTEHSSGKYFYKVDYPSQWPPAEVATKKDLLDRFFDKI